MWGVRQVGWLAGWLVCWFVCWLVAWLVSDLGGGKRKGGGVVCCLGLRAAWSVGWDGGRARRGAELGWHSQAPETAEWPAAAWLGSFRGPTRNNTNNHNQTNKHPPKPPPAPTTLNPPNHPVPVGAIAIRGGGGVGRLKEEGAARLERSQRRHTRTQRRAQTRLRYALLGCLLAPPNPPNPPNNQAQQQTTPEVITTTT